jgi:hypothetical protein
MLTQPKMEFRGLPDQDLRITKLYTFFIVSSWLKGIAVKTEFQINQAKRFEKISFRSSVFVYLYKTYYAKHLTSLCSVSIVKRGHLLLPIFESPHKKGENRKKDKKIIVVRRGCQST